MAAKAKRKPRTRRIRLLRISHYTPSLPPKFALISQSSQDKLRIMLMQILGGKQGALWKMSKRRIKSQFTSF